MNVIWILKLIDIYTMEIVIDQNSTTVEQVYICFAACQIMSMHNLNYFKNYLNINMHKNTIGTDQ